MKVVMNESKKITIINLLVGEVFTVERKSVKDELGVYMKVDKRSGLCTNKTGTEIAINLKSGQLRSFQFDTVIEKVNAKVVVD